MKTQLLLLFTLIIFCACNNKFPKNANKGKSFDLEQKTDELAQRYLELGRFNGNILIAEKGQIQYNKNFGFAKHQTGERFSEKTTFKIGKLSKLFINELLESWIEEGMFKPKDSLSNYLEVYNETMLIEDLLGNDNEQNGLLNLFIEAISENNFDNLFSDFCAASLLENTWFEQAKGNSLATGHLYRYNGHDIEWSESPLSQHPVSFTTDIKASALDVLKIIERSENKLYEISGYLADDGFSYALESNESFVILVLSNNRHPVGTEIIEYIKAIRNNEAYSLPLKRAVVQLSDSKLLKEYAGTYKVSPDFNLEILTENDKLYAKMGPNKMQLFPQSDNQFFMKNTDAAIRFLRNENGKVDKAMMLDGFIEGNEISKIK